MAGGHELDGTVGQTDPHHQPCHELVGPGRGRKGGIGVVGLFGGRRHLPPAVAERSDSEGGEEGGFF